ncbi:putative photosynthetic complex assembly protein PuhE [Thetidibacter halocola]|uniref:putative photosynthetic complex assembly protein PuhE n=1 Tax=Thetidibacter halocola TaxID=2827239 RepID=UPI0020123CC3|nr:putative photosynthetic complex assembly protein PuhE [Thetidibacter halocola]
MNDPWIAALVALFLWWFSTGAILVAVRIADRRGLRAGHMATVAALPMLGLGVWGIAATADHATPGAVYHAFLSALAIWGWIEMAFLTGTITGPNRMVLRRGVAEWERFIRAWGTIAYHEILLTGATIALGLFLWDAANPFGFLTFALLFAARVSAKLNLFLGVPKINTEFLPAALAHLPSHFRHARLNWLFPISITGLTLAVGCWLALVATSEHLSGTIGFSLLSAMTALALLEHWFMVLPLPDEKLWRWMLPAPKPEMTKTTTEDAHGL